MKEVFRLKRAQMMNMPFQMIFGIFLIAIFLIAAVFVIKNFLDMQSCSQIGLFTRDLQDKVTAIWSAQSAQQTFDNILPGSIKYVCFLNYSREKALSGLNAEQREIASKIYDDLSIYKYSKSNFFFYPARAACQMPSKNLLHLDTGSIPNPFCIENKGKISIKLYKGFDDVSVKVRQ